MSIQQFCLRWNNHQPNFISVFTTLLNTESLVDVTLAAEGRHLQAHKVVLSACSVYFQTLFTENPSRHPIVILKDVKYSDLRIMVDFMYYGEVNVSQEQLPQVLETAKMLKIKGLTEMPESTSLTRSQGTMAEFLSPNEPESQRHSASPSNSPTMAKRRKNRRPSNGTQQSNMEEPRQDSGSALELGRGDSITLSSLPQQRRRIQDYHDDRTVDATQQTEETQNNMHGDDPLQIDTNPPGLSQGGQWNMMEHAYPRYSNCLGGTLQQDGGNMGYMNNVMSQHMGVDAGMHEYGGGGGGSGGVAGPSPGPSCAPDAQQPQDPPPPQRRRRTSNPQSEENFQRALEAVRFGGIGFCKAARMFGVNNRTLWLEYKKKEEEAGPSISQRRRHFQRQGRLRRISEELPTFKTRRYTSPFNQPSSCGSPILQKHSSHPPMAQTKSRSYQEESAHVHTRTVRFIDRQHHSEPGPSFEDPTPRASHTPAMRSGPPLSCNFCWNTVDECGRILRRKTQYHCPECRTNLCIVPCFHEYHDGTTEQDPLAIAK